MPLPRIGALESLPVLSHPELVAPPVHEALKDWPGATEVAVVEIDPAYADTRADVNNLVKRTLDVRKASFLSMERAVEESAMEYGGITPVGLPETWRVLVDDACLEIEAAIIGSGVRRSKLLVPGRLLGELPGAEVLAGLGLMTT